MSEFEYQLRKPCRCGGTVGWIETRNGQDCVFCGRCGKHQYNAPKHETGREPRTVSTGRVNIKPKRRFRLMERAGGKCEVCGATGNLHIDHALSVADGLAHGLTVEELNDDENLVVLCDECNLGKGAWPFPIRLMTRILSARIKRQGATDAELV